MKRLKVIEHHNTTSESEVVTTKIQANKEYQIVVEHLASQNCIVVDMVYPDNERLRIEKIYYL